MPQPDPAGAHSRFADAYRHRIQYLPEWFGQLAAQLPLNRQARVLDLCCGSGQLAQGLAPHVAEVAGIDAAEGMLRRAPGLPNARWICHDANSQAPCEAIAGERFDHLFLGRAIAYVEADALARFIGHHLHAEGTVVVCGAGILADTEWAARYLGLRGSYAPVRGDFTGAAKLPACGFRFDGRIGQRAAFSCNAGFLLDHALSFALSHDAIRADLPRFRARLAQIERDHAQDGRLRGTVVSWGLVYRREGQLRMDRDRAEAQLRAGPYPL